MIITGKMYEKNKLKAYFLIPCIKKIRVFKSFGIGTRMK
jgi:hypothetical protein